MTREEAIDGVEKIKNYLCAGNPLWDTTTIFEVLDMAISALESQERETGKWIAIVAELGDHKIIVEGYKCSKCGRYDAEKDNFCPDCGAKMEGGNSHER